MPLPAGASLSLYVLGFYLVSMDSTGLHLCLPVGAASKVTMCGVAAMSQKEA